MIAFHGVGSIDKFSDTSCKLEVFRKLLPIVLPGPDYNGILFSPFGVQVQKLRFSSLLTDCLIDKLQVLHELFLVLTAHIFDGITDLMYDTELDIVSRYTLRIASGKPLRPSTQAIRISCTPQFCKSVSTLNQKFAPSFLDMYIPNRSLYSSTLIHYKWHG